MHPSKSSYRLALWMLLSLIGLFAVHGCSGPERTVYRAGNSYLPLLDGRQLEYEERSGEESHTYTMTIEFAGGQIVKVYPVKFKGVDFGECTFLSRDSVVDFGTNNPYFALEPRGELPEYREMWVDAAAETGDRWQDSDTGTETTFVGYESVQVPAGNYGRCYKTVTTVIPEYFDSLDMRRERGDLSGREYERERERARNQITRWFAPGVGLVKEQVGSGILRVLTAIRNEGTGGIDTTSPTIHDIPS